MKVERRGGAREGTGPKKPIRSYSDKFKADMLKALDKKAKATGKTIYDVFCDKLWDEKQKMPTAWAANFRSLCEIMVTKETKSTIEKHEIGPRIGLPPIKQPDEDTIYPKMAPKGLMN
jgi:hypothetical protein